MSSALIEIEPQALALEADERVQLAFRLLDSCGAEVVRKAEISRSCEVLVEAIGQMENGEGISADDLHLQVFGRIR
ncbi:MAG: hypothetical protein KDL87_00755 [Verrucomicrobiae bacterium]|nr:hypothetical protein [Verrucomicrobiae bacterium]